MSEIFYNPALKERPRYQPAPVIPVQTDTSILEWLEGQGRLIDRDDKEVPVEPTLEDFSAGILEEDEAPVEEDDIADDSDEM